MTEIHIIHMLKSGLTDKSRDSQDLFKLFIVLSASKSGVRIVD
jgi:hypothetical protein